MKRVLVISYYWPPTGGSGVQRWVKLCKYLPSNGWQPVVFTPENPEAIAIDHSLENDISSKVEVLKMHITEPYEFYRRIMRVKGQSRPARGRREQEVNPIHNSSDSMFYKKLSLWIRANMFVPDPRVGWVGPAVRHLERYLSEHPVDVIVSTGPPHSMHLIAKKLASKHNIPWVADFRDPWTKMFYFKHLPLNPIARRKQYKLEKEVLDGADAIVAVSPMVADEFAQMTLTPVHLITNGYDANDFPENTDTPASQEWFHITHTGLFASDGNPDVLWKTLREIKETNPLFAQKLKLTLAGKIDRQILDSIEENGLGDNLENLGYCDHNMTVIEQRRASILILPLRKEPEYKAVVPGKIFEYLASRVPVLGIGEPEGAAARIVKDCKAGTFVDWDDAQEMKSQILSVFEAFKEGKTPRTSGNIEKYSRKNTAQAMAQLFNQLCKK